MYECHCTLEHLQHKLLHFPIICNFCWTMGFMGIISDVFALLTPTTINTCTCTYAYTSNTSTFIHANPCSPPHTRNLTSILNFYFTILFLSTSSSPHAYPHAHHTTHPHLYTPTHIPRPWIFTFGLLFHSDFPFLTRLCPFHEPGGSGTSSPPDWSSTPYAGSVLHRWFSQAFSCPFSTWPPFPNQASSHCRRTQTPHTPPPLLLYWLLLHHLLQHHRLPSNLSTNRRIHVSPSGLSNPPSR